LKRKHKLKTGNALTNNQGSKMEILHLEDDGPLREIMHIALSAADPKLKMTQFIDSDAAMEYITANVDKITLYVLDVRVPGELDGLGVAQKIRELGSKRPILVTSAYRKPDQEKMAAYNCKWMAKPWHLLDAPQAILNMAKNDGGKIVTGRLKSHLVSEVLRPRVRQNDKGETTSTTPKPANPPKPYLEELQDIRASDTQNMQTVPLEDNEMPENHEPDLVETPLPFDDEPLALGDADVLDFTDMIVTIAREELEKDQNAADVPMYTSDDAPLLPDDGE
jgi:hypothetical protein